MVCFLILSYIFSGSQMNVLVTGPSQTPYEKGFFHFFMRLPHNYPIQPPRVKFLTTGGGTVRFNPNLYANGKVCLSILGYVTIGINKFTKKI